jgi:hypothetical protein
MPWQAAQIMKAALPVSMSLALAESSAKEMAGVRRREVSSVAYFMMVE